ncbi:hypothetical protein BpHYR1_040940 [Brachionus plicatilis]|uniref:Uncharacterized protein n=1 Tax=Brachionus plicatilis TaxID=10195 RepID=A0A3M7STT1_BRAPC|nr:hypothetical protein BpHYR1_040940 [Brachionus plicatilis]
MEEIEALFFELFLDILNRCGQSILWGFLNTKDNKKFVADNLECVHIKYGFAFKILNFDDGRIDLKSKLIPNEARTEK